MGPFRDELAIAHATIARLEAEIRELRASPDKPKAKVPWSNPILGLVVLAAGVGLVILIGIGGTVVRGVAADRTFRGVAIAPHDPIPPVVDNGAGVGNPPASRALDRQNPSASDKKCKCSPGDPLCSCQ